MGKKIEINLADVEKYAQVCDNKEDIARALGISPRTLYSRQNEFADFADAIKNGKAKANVFVGGKLMELIKENNVTAIIFYLKTRCGWQEKQLVEMTGKDGGAIINQTETVLNDDQVNRILDIMSARQHEPSAETGN